MTDYNFICAKPYEIGFMASVNFIGFTIGSLFFVRMADVYGRKPVLLIATSVSPIGITCLIFFGKTLMSVYIIVFCMGLTYSTRTSVSYLFA
jgi:MFS family permease